MTPSAEADEPPGSATPATPGRVRRAGGSKAAQENQRLAHELQLREVELERSRELYDLAPVGLFTLGRSGAILQTNLAGAALLGTDRAGLPGASFTTFVAEGERPVLEGLLEEIFAAPGPRSWEVTLVPRDRPERIVAIEAALTGGQQECLCAVTDITDRKRAEQQMQTQYRDLQRWRDATLDREERIQALKNEVNLALARAGQAARYQPSPARP